MEPSTARRGCVALKEKVGYCSSQKSQHRESDPAGVALTRGRTKYKVKPSLSVRSGASA